MLSMLNALFPLIHTTSCQVSTTAASVLWMIDLGQPHPLCPALSLIAGGLRKHNLYLQGRHAREGRDIFNVFGEAMAAVADPGLSTSPPTQRGLAW